MFAIIQNAIKSKDVESFIKRNKKLIIVISAKKLQGYPHKNETD
jgi:hypothetical protein